MIDKGVTCVTCGGELSDMKTGCKRCLKCHPIVDPPKPKKDDRKYVDKPWTEDRSRAIVKDEMENWHKITTAHTEKLDLKITESAIPSSMDKPEVVVAGNGKMPEGIEIPLEPPKWTDQAESLGIPWRGRKKETVLDEIEVKLTVPDEG